MAVKSFIGLALNSSIFFILELLEAQKYIIDAYGYTAGG
jgi:hypothetical protein